NPDFDPPKRLIIYSRENKSHQNQLSTTPELMQQIPMVRFERMTTPLTVETFHNDHTLNTEEPEIHPHTLGLKSYQNVHEPDFYLSNHKIYPNHQYDASLKVEEPNHRYNVQRQVEEPNHRYDVRRQEKEIQQPRPFEYILRGTPPTAFQ